MSKRGEVPNLEIKGMNTSPEDAVAASAQPYPWDKDMRGLPCVRYYESRLKNA